MIAASILLLVASKSSSTTYYFSPAGDDANIGIQQTRPWKSLAKLSTVRLGPGDKVLLQGGASFEGSVIAADGVTIGSYGKGARGLVCGPHIV